MPILGTPERRTTAFQRLWATTATNNLADGVLRLVTPVGAVGLGATPAQLAVVVAAQTAPWLILSPASGVVADRHPPHLIIRWASVLRALACVGLLEALNSTGAPIGLLAVCALALGSAEVVADIAAQTAVPDIVSDDDLEWAYGRIKATQIAADTLVGPALGGLLLGLNATAAVATAIGLFAVGAATVPRVHDRQRASGQETVRSQLVDGWKATWADAWIRRALLTVAAMNAASVASATALIAYAVEPGPLGLTEPQYGALIGAAGLGAAAGGPVAARLAQTLLPRTLIQIGLSGHVIMLAAPVPSDQPAFIAALLLAGAALSPAFAVTIISTRQRRVDPSMRGRVNAIFQTIATGTGPAGALLAGAMIGPVGFRTTFVTAATLVAIAALSARPWNLNA